MPHDPERWARIQALFRRAIDLPERDRRAFLDAECADDAGILAEVAELLEEDALAGSLLDSDVASIAGRVLDGSVPHIEHVGPYRILGVLGHGGMGVVYLARRDDLGSNAAIKVLRDASFSPARRDRFAVEQRTLAQLDHPSIARLYDADTLPDGTPYFVMEHVVGEPLTTYCASRSLSVTERLELFRAVCEAVQAAHRRAIIHRDLKPSNVLVTADGAPKLLDFGIARQLDTLDSTVDQTVTAFRLLTPAYASPEQVRGEPVGTYTDVYALGVILYELLAGRLPFDLSRLTPGQAEVVIANTEPAKPSIAASTTDSAGDDSADASRSMASASVMATANAPGRAAWADLDVLCLTAMHKDPQRRYRTVEALIRDIDHFLHAEPLEARPDSLGYRADKFLRRNWRAVGIAATVVITVSALVAYYTISLAAARDDALAEAARAHRLQQFTLELFQGGDDAVGPSDSLRVVSLLDRGVAEASVLDAEPLTQAELYHTLGTIFQKLGDLERADSLLNLALERRRAIAGEDDAATASSVVALGVLRVDQADLAEGERLIREGLEATRRRFPADHPAVLQAETALGFVLQEQGEYDNAIAVLANVVRAGSTNGPTRDVVDAMRELANTHFYASNLAESDSVNRTVLELDRQFYGERHPRIGDTYINLGAIRFQQGEYAEAERYYRDALELMSSYYGWDHPATASNLTMLGRALNYQEKYDEAVDALTRALAIQERVFGPMHPRIASTSNDLGIVALGREDYNTAASYFRRMVDIYDDVYRGDHWLVGIATANLASVHLDQEHWAEAEPLFREAIDVFTRTLGENDLQTGISRIKLGRVLVGMRRWTDAERDLRGGYDILQGLTNPSVSWLQSARRNLALVYDSIGRPADAVRFRKELSDTTGAS
jgi:serine/threonine-protein kinase